jgi:Domain of unknown function (DUF4352)
VPAPADAKPHVGQWEQSHADGSWTRWFIGTERGPDVVKVSWWGYQNTDGTIRERGIHVSIEDHGGIAVLDAAGLWASRTSSRPSALSTAPAEPATPTTAPAGSAVRDGKFEFRVLDMTRAKQAGDLSNQFEIVDAQGEFIILTLSVTNIGDQAQSYFGTNQKLVDTAGREYEANSTADMWANKGTGDINPGNSIQVRAAFDVPPGTQPAQLEVHDSMFSGGAKVRL